MMQEKYDGPSPITKDAPKIAGAVLDYSYFMYGQSFPMIADAITISVNDVVIERIDHLTGETETSGRIDLDQHMLPDHNNKITIEVRTYAGLRYDLKEASEGAVQVRAQGQVLFAQQYSTNTGYRRSIDEIYIWK